VESVHAFSEGPVVMLRGMRVILHGLQNHPGLNGLRGNVVSVRDDDRLRVQLDKNGTVVVVQAKHVLEWESDGIRNVYSFEFAEGTSEQDIDIHVREFCRINVMHPETELHAFIRPHGALSSVTMSPLNRTLLVQAGRLEHMGTLTRTAELLGWVLFRRGSPPCDVYVNASLRRARSTTKDLFLNHTDESLVYTEEDKRDR